MARASAAACRGGASGPIRASASAIAAATCSAFAQPGADLRRECQRIDQPPGVAERAVQLGRAQRSEEALRGARRCSRANPSGGSSAPRSPAPACPGSGNRRSACSDPFAEQGVDHPDAAAAAHARRRQAPGRPTRIRPSRARRAGCRSPPRAGSGRPCRSSIARRRTAGETRARLRRDAEAAPMSRRLPPASPAPGRAPSRAADSAAARRRRRSPATCRRDGRAGPAPPIGRSVPSAATPCASSRVKPPTNTPSRPEHRPLVGGEQPVAPVERGAQRLMAAQRNGARPPVRTWKRSSSRARRPSMPSNRTRAAASSIASGMPSSRRQISRRAARLPALNCEARDRQRERARRTTRLRRCRRRSGVPERPGCRADRPVPRLLCSAS